MRIVFNSGGIFFIEVPLWDSSRLYTGASRDSWNIVVRECTTRGLGDGYYDVLIYSRKKNISREAEIDLFQSFGLKTREIILQHLYPNKAKETALLDIAEEKKRQRAYQPKTK